MQAMDDRLVVALAAVEEAEESLRIARALIRALFESQLPLLPPGEDVSLEPSCQP